MCTVFRINLSALIPGLKSKINVACLCSYPECNSLVVSGTGLKRSLNEWNIDRAFQGLDYRKKERKHFWRAICNISCLQRRGNLSLCNAFFYRLRQSETAQQRDSHRSSSLLTSNLKISWNFCYAGRAVEMWKLGLCFTFREVCVDHPCAVAVFAWLGECSFRFWPAICKLR